MSMSKQCASIAKRRFANLGSDVPVQVWKHLAESDERSLAPPGGGPLALAYLIDDLPAMSNARQIDDGEPPPGRRSPGSARSGSFFVRR